MQEKDALADTKKLKNRDNASLQTPSGGCRPKQPTDESVERLRRLYQKTEEMKEVSKSKNEELEDQFKMLKERLSTSSGFLNHIKKSIENIKFSYQRDILDLERVTEENRCEIDEQIEEIREHIDKLQSRVVEDESQKKGENYQDAFRDVLRTFEVIARGKFASQNQE